MMLADAQLEAILAQYSDRWAVEIDIRDGQAYYAASARISVASGGGLSARTRFGW